MTEYMVVLFTLLKIKLLSIGHSDVLYACLLVSVTGIKLLIPLSFSILNSIYPDEMTFCQTQLQGATLFAHM